MGNTLKCFKLPGVSQRRFMPRVKEIALFFNVTDFRWEIEFEVAGLRSEVILEL